MQVAMVKAVMQRQDSQAVQLREAGVLEEKNRTTSLRHESQAYIHANRIRGDSSVSLTYSGEYEGKQMR